MCSVSAMFLAVEKATRRVATVAFVLSGLTFLEVSTKEADSSSPAEPFPVLLTSWSVDDGWSFRHGDPCLSRLWDLPLFIGSCLHKHIASPEREPLELPLVAASCLEFRLCGNKSSFFRSVFPGCNQPVLLFERRERCQPNFSATCNSSVHLSILFANEGMFQCRFHQRSLRELTMVQELDVHRH